MSHHLKAAYGKNALRNLYRTELSAARGDRIQLLRSKKSYWTQSQAQAGNSLVEMLGSEYILFKT